MGIKGRQVVVKALLCLAGTLGVVALLFGVSPWPEGPAPQRAERAPEELIEAAMASPLEEAEEGTETAAEPLSPVVEPPAPLIADEVADVMSSRAAADMEGVDAATVDLIEAAVKRFAAAALEKLYGAVRMASAPSVDDAQDETAAPEIAPAAEAAASQAGLASEAVEAARDVPMDVASSAPVDAVASPEPLAGVSAAPAAAEPAGGSSGTAPHGAGQVGLSHPGRPPQTAAGQPEPVPTPHTLSGVMGYRLPLVSRQQLPDQVVSGVLIPAHTTYVILQPGYWELVGLSPPEVEGLQAIADKANTDERTAPSGPSGGRNPFKRPRKKKSDGE